MTHYITQYLNYIKWVPDVLFAVIIVVCAWRGYKNGIIRGICGILAIIVSLYGANIIATAYSDEFTGMAKPFVEGIVDTSVSNVLNDAKKTMITVRTSDKDDVYTVCYAASRELGICDAAADKLAREMADDTSVVDQEMTELLSAKLCSKLAFAGLAAIAFILIAIVFAVIGNLINLSFQIEALGAAEPIIGTLLGIAKGIIIVLALATIFRYTGKIIPDTAVETTKILPHILNNNPVADRLGL